MHFLLAQCAGLGPPKSRARPMHLLAVAFDRIVSCTSITALLHARRQADAFPFGPKRWTGAPQKSSSTNALASGRVRQNRELYVDKCIAAREATSGCISFWPKALDWGPPKVELDQCTC